ncbi:hypothetical protein ILYODFUR_011477 [Ilyodon furcidens]|uniref:Uncharacterized protein n=1 Tax=Ilyodon furcidens TaxID=33524 RepID=A0ABV0UJF0_9TELE
MQENTSSILHSPNIPQPINPEKQIIQSHLISTESHKREQNGKKRSTKAQFKFRPTVQLGLAALPHAPDTLYPSTTPSSPTLSEPSPSAQSRALLTSCLPLTLRYPLPPPSSGRPPKQTG